MNVRRPILEVYYEQSRLKLSKYVKQLDSVYVTSYKGPNLTECIRGRLEHCKSNHVTCEECPAMFLAANTVLETGYVTLKSVFTSSLFLPVVFLMFSIIMFVMPEGAF